MKVLNIRKVFAMESQNIIKISVRNLVEYVFMSGDIVTGFTSSTRLQDAIKAHQLVQKSGGEKYLSEVAVSKAFDMGDIILDISGRIDGVIEELDGITIDEIKTTSRSLSEIHEDYSPVHWAQAKCYGYIYALQNNLQSITIQLTYFQIDTGEIKSFSRQFSIEELQEFITGVIDEYLVFARKILEWQIIRNESIRELNFPFQEYRRGQRELAVAVYKTIREGKLLFAQAPTGTGKTIASMFPSIKALSEGEISKLFYLTAKTITRSVAESAVRLMEDRGLRLKTITITAKEKLCERAGDSCSPEECEYARGHYDRVKSAIVDILNEDMITRETIEMYSKKHRVCPFEFSLDVSNFCDLIICDYNYVFDPSVYLKRFFLDGGGDYGFLIDEAHNLVDRGREMFSAELFKKPFLDMKKSSKEISWGLYESLDAINKYMININKLLEAGVIIEKEKPKELYSLLRKFVKEADQYLARSHGGEFEKNLLDLYFEVSNFLKTAELYNEGFVTYYEREGRDLKAKVFCLDPSENLREALKRGKSAIFFSATLNPMEYFIRILGGDKDSYKIRLESPFPRENLCLILENRISTRYKNREQSYSRIVDLILSTINKKKGNYMVYFPSYRYMEEVYTLFKEEYPDFNIIAQRGAMNEGEREEFLKSFTENEEQELLGFAVMGGMFSEGIDLTGDKLLGAIIIGVGLPKLCLERDIIKNHFNEKNLSGFDFSYTYPGMNKVMQAVGRVIRTSRDRGVVVLVDDRFSSQKYRGLFPSEWSHIKVARELEKMENYIEDFWEHGCI